MVGVRTVHEYISLAQSCYAMVWFRMCHIILTLVGGIWISCNNIVLCYLFVSKLREVVHVTEDNSKPRKSTVTITTGDDSPISPSSPSTGGPRAPAASITSNSIPVRAFSVTGSNGRAVERKRTRTRTNTERKRKNWNAEMMKLVKLS